MARVKMASPARLKEMVLSGERGFPYSRNWDGWAMAMVRWMVELSAGQEIMTVYFVNCLAALPFQKLRRSDYTKSPYGSIVWFNNGSDGNAMIHLGDGKLLAVGKGFDEEWLVGLGVLNEMPADNRLFYVGWSKTLR